MVRNTGPVVRNTGPMVRNIRSNSAEYKSHG